jgi:hypothetical protein
MRPGILGTLALLQKTAFAVATVAAAEVTVNAAIHAMVSHPLLRHLAGDVAGAGVAARRMILLSRAVQRRFRRYYQDSTANSSWRNRAATGRFVRSSLLRRAARTDDRSPAVNDQDLAGDVTGLVGQ